jgi:death-on-curing protein
VSEAPEPRWVGRLVVDIIQHDLVVTHGGLRGLRDEAALESALARPRQLWTYSEDATIPVLAAAYAFGIARSHPYNDGNKRIAFVVSAVFAELNGLEFVAPEAEVVDMMLRLASGDLEEEALAAWLASRLMPMSRHHSGQRVAHNPRTCASV